VPGRWGACAICAELVERGDRLELMLRAARASSPGLSDAEIRAAPHAEARARFMVALHDGFFLSREGPREPVPR
jgi:hypothetical protein